MTALFLPKWTWSRVDTYFASPFFRFAGKCPDPPPPHTVASNAAFSLAQFLASSFFFLLSCSFGKTILISFPTLTELEQILLISRGGACISSFPLSSTLGEVISFFSIRPQTVRWRFMVFSNEIGFGIHPFPPLFLLQGGMTPPHSMAVSFSFLLEKPAATFFSWSVLNLQGVRRGFLSDPAKTLSVHKPPPSGKFPPQVRRMTPTPLEGKKLPFHGF